MARGGDGNMLGVGGTRQKLGRSALRGGGSGGRIGGGLDPQTQKRELLRRLREGRGEPGAGASGADAPEAGHGADAPEAGHGAGAPGSGRGVDASGAGRGAGASGAGRGVDAGGPTSP
ncbi:DUF6243 family protein [Streptomyces sp. NPDC086783]|uniref:DUF6243 family protein n=1 Tax=Streptomyces sp. NPDC086783 TaxID=3365758 RepID=UPI00381192E2